MGFDAVINEGMPQAQMVALCYVHLYQRGASQLLQRRILSQIFAYELDGLDGASNSPWTSSDLVVELMKSGFTAARQAIRIFLLMEQADKTGGIRHHCWICMLVNTFSLPFVALLTKVTATNHTLLAAQCFTMSLRWCLTVTHVRHGIQTLATLHMLSEF